MALLRVLLTSSASPAKPQVSPGFIADVWPSTAASPASPQRLESILLQSGTDQVAIPVDQRAAMLVPYRGLGGPLAGSFQYVSAADLLAQRLPAGALANKVILVGSTAPCLLDLRVTPVGETCPGVEVQANVLSGLLDGCLLVRPDYASAYELLMLLVAGLLLALLLPRLSAAGAVALGVAVPAALVLVNLGSLAGARLVLPLASALVMTLAAFALNMSYGFFVESRARRKLANLFGSYVPPELAQEMMKHPYSYSMQAQTRELTVMFCDMRGFTQLSETMEPLQLQTLLNGVFTRLSEVIRRHGGTIDKYMGDCVMAFWGAPVATPDHAGSAVTAALDRVAAMRALNAHNLTADLAPIQVGIGINTGMVCVGDMGSDLRRSYTVIGDAVNLACRLEALSNDLKADIVVSSRTRESTTSVACDWRELGSVQVKGGGQAEIAFSPQAPIAAEVLDNAGALGTG